MGAVAIFVYFFLRAVCIVYMLYIITSEITIVYSKWKYKLIEREWKLLEALLQDFDEVSRCANQITKEASQPLDSKLIQAGITVRLDERAEGWMSEARQVVSEATGCVRSFQRLSERRNSSMCFVLVLIDLVPMIGLAFQLKRLNKFFGKKEICASDIYGSLAQSRSRIRSLQDNSVVDDQIEDISVKSRPLTDELISSLEEITGNRDWISGMEEQVELIMIHLKLLHAFMKDLQPLELESKMEIYWLTKTKEIIDKAKEAINKKADQNIFQKWMAMRTFKEEMMSVGAWISDLMEMKERYGFEFIRRDSLNSAHLRSPQQQTLLYQTIDDLDLLTQLTEISNESKTSAIKLSEQLNGMHELLKDRKALYASNFRSSCLAQLKEMATDIVHYSKIVTEDSELPSALTRIEVVLRLLCRCIKVYSIEVRADSCSVFGLEEDISKLVSRLTDNSKHRSIISIVGMKGIGKTTLAKKVYNHSKIAKHFEVRRWVFVPQEYDQNALLTSVGNQVLGTKESWNGKYWIKKLYNFLNNEEKRYLVVLDMVSSNEAVYALKPAFPKLTNGSKIVLTTCKRAIASNADQYSIPHQLRLRTKEESWEIFTHMMDSVGNMETLVKEVVERSSGGLPLVIIRLAYLLWETEVTSEKLRELEDINREQNKMQWLFNLVMNNRESQFHQILSKCFSYFQLFTSDFEIPVRRIAASWIAQGLVKLREENQTLEDIAYEYLLELIGRNLIQVVQRKPNGKVKTCCLPTTLRDLLLQRQGNSTKTQSWSFASTSFKGELSFHFADNDAGFHHIDGLSTSSPNVMQNKRYCNSILFFGNKQGNAPRERIHNIICNGISDSSFTQLQLLDLESVLRPQLPRNIGKLKKLAYLGLRYTKLKTIPESVGDLVNLQTLDLKHTSVQALPGSIWKSKKLRHLYLNQNCQLPKPTGISLTNLQILSNVFVDKGSPLKDGFSKLNNLRKLRLSFQLKEQEQKTLVTSILQLTNLQSLKLRSINDQNGVPMVLKGISALTKLTSLHLFGKLAEQSIINELPQTLTHLTLSASGIGADQLQKLGKLQKLKSLFLCSGSYQEENMDFLMKGFPVLLALKLSELDNLKKLEVQEGAMQELRELEIRSCKKLAIISGFVHLRTLQKYQVN